MTAVAAADTKLASSSMTVSLPSAALVAPSNTQSTVLTVTPGMTDQSTQTFEILVVLNNSAGTRDILDVARRNHSLDELSQDM